jgi:hypothetical protein
MKRPIIAGFMLVGALGWAALVGETQTGANLIVPGQSIGQTRLGANGAVYLAKLPTPDADDSGMGKYRSVWLSKKQGGRTDTLYIYSVANDPRDIQPLNGVSIWLIRVTSSWFKTSDNLSAGATFRQVRHSFPDVRPTDQSQTLYDDSARGIAFEFAGSATAGSPCVAIMVHPPGNVHLATAQDVNDILRANDIQP